VLRDTIEVAFHLHEAHQRVQEGEERYRALFYNSHSPMMLLRPETGEIVSVNPDACAFYGWSPEEFTRKRMQQINELSEEEVLREMARAREERAEVPSCLSVGTDRHIPDYGFRTSNRGELGNGRSTRIRVARRFR
jgi:PAS domain-containing protein